MRVGIDAHMVGHGETGNESYVTNLVLALEQCRLGHTFSYFRQLTDWPSPKLPEHVITRAFKPTGDMARLTFSLALAARADQLDLLHASYHAPVWSPCPLAITVHDLSFKRFPQFFNARDRLILNLLMPESLRRAAVILTGSECTRRDLVEFFPGTRQKIVVTHYAAGSEFRPISNPGAQADFCARYGIEPPFYLAVGSINPRKNLRRLIEAWDCVRTVSPSSTLVVAGPRGFGSEEVLRTAERARDPRRIRFVGRIAQPDLPLAYNSAEAMIYPSLYEGFGLPVLEAMSCGTPVLTSNVSSIPEVAGTAALLFDPQSVESIAEALHRFCENPELRQVLRERGLERATHFSWSKTAQLTWQAYTRAI